MKKKTKNKRKSNVKVRRKIYEFKFTSEHNEPFCEKKVKKESTRNISIQIS